MSGAYRFTKREAVAIHDASIARFGGLAGVRDEGLLESALAQPWQTFGGRDLYPSDVEKVCRLAFGVICDHPFVDGNKRAGTAPLGAGLRMAGFDFEPRHDELLQTMLSIADGSLGFEGLVRWVKSVVG